jgi:antitoxin component HigA of HigAB toxin-antitoxin module
LIVEHYERKRWPIEPPETIEAIRYRMETGGSTQADLGRLLGSRQRASDILASKRPLTMRMAWKLQPRVEDSGRSADRAASDAGKEVSGVARISAATCGIGT